MKRIALSIFVLMLSVSFAMAQSKDNTATVNQTNNNNTATINQTGATLNTNVVQNGNNGTANITQLAESGNVIEQNALINQVSGKGNFADIKQTQSGTGTTPTPDLAKIVQQGNTNIAKISQIAPLYSSGQTSKAFQYGNGNVSYQAIERGHTINQQYVNQNGNSNYAKQTTYSGSYQDFSIMQNGKYNDARQSITGENIHAYITQDPGNNNIAKQTLTGGSDKEQNPYNTATIKQAGNWNQAYQTLAFGPYGDSFIQSGYAKILQNGNNNYALQTMDGGINNSAIINQTDNFNTAKQWQVGDNNNAKIIQTGSNNEAYQHQNGNETGIVIQNGNSNVVYMNQYPTN
ncbi:MAG TPA: hypothetical protein VKA34_10400 [Balneolales bacterium]|nr:hypothetical protein [Balneolales bacterium]